MVALYDAPSAKICCDAGIDVLLVGDSMGNVVLGYDDTVPVTVDDIRVHTGAVARGAKSSSRPQTPVVADLPFGSYATPELAAHNGALLMRAGAHALKLEGAGEVTICAVRVLAQMGAPVVGHIGYTPQSSLRFEGIVQGKTAVAARELLMQARHLQDAGCCAIVLEAVAEEAAARITQSIEICTIGIGAGAGLQRSGSGVARFGRVVGRGAVSFREAVCQRARSFGKRRARVLAAGKKRRVSYQRTRLENDERRNRKTAEQRKTRRLKTSQRPDPKSLF